MDPRLTMMVLRKEHDRRMNAVAREYEIRRALGEARRPVGDPYLIAAGVNRALRLTGAAWARLHHDRQSDGRNPQPGSAEGSITHRDEPAAAGA